jgi:cytochrome P450
MARSGARFFEAFADRAASGSLEIDAHREMVKLTLDVVLAALFGDDLLRGADVPYQALGAAVALVAERLNSVVLPAWVPTPQNVKLRRIVRELDRTVYSIIRRARERAQDDGSLLSMLLGSVDARTGRPLSDRELRDEVITLIIAGHETTALALTWMFTFLDRRPEILDRMSREVDDALGGRDPGFEDVPKLPYVRQVIEETLRLRTPAPIIGRNVIEDDEIDGYRVKRGDIVILFLWSTHRHPAFWSDAETFDPDRFAADRDRGRHSWAFMPFSGGPRVCIGNMFAMIEASILVAQMLSRFDVRVLPCADVKPMARGTTKPSRPVRLVLRRRSAVVS